jgi:hypothetical protein
MPSCIGNYSYPTPPNKCKTCDNETQTICIETTKRNKSNCEYVEIAIPKKLYAIIELYKEPNETMNGHILELIREGVNAISDKNWKTTKRTKR